MVGHTTMHRRIAVEGKQKLRVRATNRQHLMNGAITDITELQACRWNIVASGHAQSASKISTKMLAPMSNLTWLWVAVRNCKSRTALREIWRWSQYKSYRISFLISNGYLHALIWSAVHELRLLEVGGIAEVLFWTDLSILDFWPHFVRHLREPSIPTL
jgi:hypothetical protein